jgi:hypothetical protein
MQLRDAVTVVVAAIRIDRAEIIRSTGAGDWHVDILNRWIKREGLTEEQADAALEAGRVEFGSCALDLGGGAYGLRFVPNDAKTDAYRTVEDVEANAR